MKAYTEQTEHEKHEFDGEPYYPSMFFWKTQLDQPEAVKEACRVLNRLTDEQAKAVKFLVQAERDEAEYYRE